MDAATRNAKKFVDFRKRETKQPQTEEEFRAAVLRPSKAMRRISDAHKGR